MKKRIMSLFLTGILALSVSAGVFAAPTEEKETPEKTEQTEAAAENEDSGNLIKDLITTLGLQDEVDILNSLGEQFGIRELANQLLESDPEVQIYALVNKFIPDNLLEDCSCEKIREGVSGLLSALAEKISPQIEAVEKGITELVYAEVFPSWNPDSKALAELVDFVERCTDKSSPDYVEPEDRIATFDMDGTILCEKAPIYIDWCLTMYRVLDDPSYKATEEEIVAMEQIREHAYAEGETFYPETGLTKNDVVSLAFAGMTPVEFRAYVNKFADTVDAVGFEGMTYGESFYKPMLEVMAFLKANDFDVWMVSACEREVTRGLMERFGFPYDHVVATDVPYYASGKGDALADEYNMSKDEEILLGTPLDPIECGKSNKPASIAREIGKRPILAFGNSSGDYSMLNYAEGNPDHEGMGFFVVCDDTVREYGDDKKAADYYDEVAKEGWTAISMADDWATIYGENVKKTELPGEAIIALPNAA